MPASRPAIILLHFKTNPETLPCLDSLVSARKVSDFATYIIAVQSVEPGLLAPPSFQVGGIQYVAALSSDFKSFMLPAGAIPGVQSRPAKPGETIILYGVGFGGVTPSLSAGTLVSQQNTLSNPIEIRFGNVAVTLSFAGLAPGATGLYQFNLVVPNVPDNPAVPLTLSLTGAIPSQTLFIAVQH